VLHSKKPPYPKVPRIEYEPAGVFLEQTGISRQQLVDMYPRLDAARREMLEVDEDLFQSGKPLPPDKDPLDHGFYKLPERMLSDYNPPTANWGGS
jgi:hypothetical protein